MKQENRRGFTLIELSIVLVIIGLLVGGVLVGQDLIRAAGVRATISQIEQYNAAVNTFRGKFNALPGDMNQATATAFGFASRGTLPGEGDGSGVIEGIAWGTACGFCTTQGETAMFWSDLTYANNMNLNMIAGSFSTASNTSAPASPLTGNGIDLYLPQAKIGNGNYVYVWSGGYTSGYPWASPNYGSDGQNYFGIAAISIFGGVPGNAYAPYTWAAAGMTAKQAYSIDSKIDDGLPQSGNVKAIFECSGIMLWAAGNNACSGPVGGQGPGGEEGPDNVNNCYDNDRNASNPMHYSFSSQSGGGNNVNCALSFRFQ